jgi:hypothetical protein
MALHKTLDSKDLYPVEQAGKIAHTLTQGEKREEESRRWAYVIVADKKQPGLAAIAVYDETNTFVGWWYR